MGVIGSSPICSTNLTAFIYFIFRTCYTNLSQIASNEFRHFEYANCCVFDVLIIEQSIIGSDRFFDKIKREYLLFRSSDENQEPGLVHLQQSFLVDEIINHVANVFKIKFESILQRRSKDKDARRLAMYCASNYCRHRNTLSDLATRFGVSVSALAQARDRVANNLSPSLQKKLTKIVNAIAK